MSKVIILVVLISLGAVLEVKGEIASWFTSGQHTAHHQQDKNRTVTPLHQILNVTKGETKPRGLVDADVDATVTVLKRNLVNADVDATVTVLKRNLVDADVDATVTVLKRDASSAGGSASTAGSASAQQFASGFAAPPQVPPFGGYPPVGYPPMGGFFPGFGAGGGGGLNLALDAGLGGGIIGGIAPYFPIIEKVIVIVGGGILILIFLAIVHALLLKGGFLPGLLPGFGVGASAAKSFAGGVDVDVGPFHTSKSASGSLAFDQQAGLTQKVMNGVNRQW